MRPAYFDEDRDFEVRGRLGARGSETWEPELVLSDRLSRAERFFCGVEGVYRNVATITDSYINLISA
jgi:hypothetical protein